MNRLYYYVAACDGRWEVRYDGQAEATRYLYVTQQAAIDAALAASRAHWDEGRPSGVRIEHAPGQWRDLRKFGGPTAHLGRSKLGPSG